jgi:hypothetical protein
MQHSDSDVRTWQAKVFRHELVDSCGGADFRAAAGFMHQRPAGLLLAPGFDLDESETTDPPGRDERAGERNANDVAESFSHFKKEPFQRGITVSGDEHCTSGYITVVQFFINSECISHRE